MSLNVTAFNHVDWDRFGLANYEDFADRISECNVGEDTFSGSREWFSSRMNACPATMP